MEKGRNRVRCLKEVPFWIELSTNKGGGGTARIKIVNQQMNGNLKLAKPNHFRYSDTVIICKQIGRLSTSKKYEQRKGKNMEVIHQRASTKSRELSN